MSIEIKFFEESIKIPSKKSTTFGEFKNIVSLRFNFDPVEVNEMIFKYVDDENDRVTISSEEDYKFALQIKKPLKIEIDLVEGSKLFKAMNEQIPKEESAIDLLKKEIEAKEKELQEAIKREAFERMKKQEEEARIKAKEQEMKIEEELKKAKQLKKEEKKKRIAEEKNKAKIKSEEEQFQEAIFQSKVEDIVTKIVSVEIEKSKQSIINSLTQKSVREIKDDKMINNQPKVHSGFFCDGCGVGPIVGIRYNCTVCKNFDYCQVCEDKISHPHAFIKLKTNEVKPIKTFGKPRKLRDTEMNLDEELKLKFQKNICTNPVEDINNNNYIEPLIKEKENKETFEIKAKEIKKILNLKVSEEEIAKELQNTNGDVDMALSTIFRK